MPGEDSDSQFLDDARERSRRVLDTVSRDLESLRSAGSDAAYAEGAALSEDVADALRNLITQLETERPHP